MDVVTYGVVLSICRRKRLAENHCRMSLGLVWLILLIFIMRSPVLLASECSPLAGSASCSAEPDPGSASNNHQPNPLIGNPVNLITGNKFQMEQDWQSTHSNLTLHRFYNSARSDLNIGLGQGWRHSYQTYMQVVSDSELNIVQSNGRKIVFNRVLTESPVNNENNEYTSDAIRWFAVAHPDGMIDSDKNYRYWKLPDGKTITFKGPYMVEIRYHSGEVLRMIYKNHKLDRVVDFLGRELTFHYSDGVAGLGEYTDEKSTEIGGHLNRVKLPGGLSIRFDFDMNRNLIGAHRSDNLTTKYAYEDSDFPSHLTKVVNAQHQRVSTWRYNNRGQVESTHVGLGVTSWSIDFDYVASSEAYGHTTVEVQGKATQHDWMKDDPAGHAVILSSSEICEGCQNPSRQYFFDEHWQAKSPDDVRDDANANRPDVFKRRVDTEADRKTPITRKKDKLPLVVTPLDGTPVSLLCGLNYSGRCRELENAIRYGEIAECTYILMTCPFKWDLVSPEDIGLKRKDFWSGRFTANLHYDPIEQEHVLSFVGTDEPADWIDNIGQYKGIKTTQYEMAVELATAVKDALKGDKLKIVGHSLGGGLASLAAAATGVSAVTFNAASVHPDIQTLNGIPADSASDSITTYSVKNDPLTVFQNSQFSNLPPALGTKHELNQVSEAWISAMNHYPESMPSALKKALTAHSMAGVMKSVTEEYETLKCNRHRGFRT